jgi:DNA-binding CsgD family transcriptional regulator
VTVVSVAELATLHREPFVDDEVRGRSALSQVQSGLSSLQSAASVTALADAAPRIIVQYCGFDRAGLTRIQDGRLRVESVYFGDDVIGAAKMIAYAQSRPPRVQRWQLETQMIRRLAPVIVRDPHNDSRVNARFAEWSDTQSFVAAPVLRDGTVIGFLHADHRHSGRTVDEVDRDTLAVFAAGFGYAFDRAMLHERLKRQQADVWRALACGDEPTSTPQSGAPHLRSVDDFSEKGRRSVAEAQWVLDSTLSRRETDVLRLVAAGFTNQQIAEDLFVSIGTVKAHVKSVLRKLQAANRTDAASIYLRMASTVE